MCDGNDSTSPVSLLAACNKTYYGDVGKTYDLELHRPKEDKVPYICKLTFNAPGDDFGDIVQVSAIRTEPNPIRVADVASLAISLFIAKKKKKQKGKQTERFPFAARDERKRRTKDAPREFAINCHFTESYLN